jgi:hypothetical protein
MAIMHMKKFIALYLAPISHPHLHVQVPFVEVLECMPIPGI